MEKRVAGVGYDFCAFLDYDFSGDFVLYEIGSYQCTPKYSYGPVIRPRTIIHFVHSGKGILTLNEVTYHIKENQAFLIPAGTNAYYEADATDPWNYSWLHLGGRLLNEVLEQAGFNEQNPVYISSPTDTMIQAILLDIFREYERPYYTIGKLYELFDYLINYSSNKKEMAINPQMQYVRKVIKYVQLKYSEPIKVNDIATGLGINRSYLSRLFKEATGSSIQDYLLSYRMKMATNLLKDSQNTVSFVAFAVGYNDAFTFSKAYKRYTGKSPSDI